MELWFHGVQIDRTISTLRTAIEMWSILSLSLENDGYSYTCIPTKEEKRVKVKYAIDKV